MKEGVILMEMVFAILISIVTLCLARGLKLLARKALKQN
jgi:hypothetical protein